MDIYAKFCCFVLCFAVVSGATKGDNKTDSDYPTLQNDWFYCYEFTWFGPDFDNVTRYNGTCSDYLDDTRATDMPCSPPIVISYDGSPPDMHYLWDKYRSSILCKRSESQRCFRYTYLFNGKPSNVTYGCARIRSANGQNVGDGCFTQTVSGSYKTELCTCKSSKGIFPPCNSAPHVYVGSILFTFTLSIITLFVSYSR